MYKYCLLTMGLRNNRSQGMAKLADLSFDILSASLDEGTWRAKRVVNALGAISSRLHPCLAFEMSKKTNAVAGSLFLFIQEVYSITCVL